MKAKALNDFLFSIFDYAEYLSTQFQPGKFENNNNFLTLVFIEKFFDRVGRGEIIRAAKELGFQQDEISNALLEANKRLKNLRSRIFELSREYDLNETLKYAGEQLASEWKK